MIIPFNSIYSGVSFGMLKKSSLNGLDLFAAERYKAPLEKFSSNEDLQNWCTERIKNKYLNKNYEGRTSETSEQRKNILQKWFDCCKKYSPAEALLIIEGITAGLKSSNDSLPPVLNRDVLDKTLECMQKESEDRKNYQQSFIKLYSSTLKTIYSGRNQGYTGWIVIPSMEEAPEDFEKNTAELKALSHKTWCTKSFNTAYYLEKGSFHIYLENSEPKLAARFLQDNIQEIQGEKNDGKIPLKYLDILKEHIKGCKINDKASKQLQAAENAVKKFKDIITALNKPVSEASAEELFKAAGIKYERDKESGLLILDEYRQPDRHFSWNDLGVSENKLFKAVKEIKGDVYFADINASDLGSLEKIGGSADFINSKVSNLGALKYIGGNADFPYSNIINLQNLEYIGGNANFTNSNVQNLGTLKRINKDAYFQFSKIKNLGSLKFIGGNADFMNSIVNNLGSLEYIGGSAVFSGSPVEEPGNLKFIGGDLLLSESNVKDISKVKTGGKVYL